MAWKFYSRIQKILTGEDIKPLNSTEAAVKYAIDNAGGGGTSVVANPTLAGTEDSLTGLQVGNTKYAVPIKILAGTFAEVDENQTITLTQTATQVCNLFDAGYALFVRVHIYSEGQDIYMMCPVQYARKNTGESSAIIDMQAMGGQTFEYDGSLSGAVVFTPFS